LGAVAAEFGTSAKTCAKWVSRYRADRERGLCDRSSAPKRQGRQVDAHRVDCIVALRRLRFTGPEIAELLAMPLSTVSGILKRQGLGKLGRLGLAPAERYERAAN
jgi:transposase